MFKYEGNLATVACYILCHRIDNKFEAVIWDPLEVFKSGVVKLKENGLWQLCFDHKYVFYKVAQGMAIMEEDVFVNSCVG